MFYLFLTWLVAYIFFWLVTDQKSGFKKPLEHKKRPKWFLALWVSLSFGIILSSPVTSVSLDDIGSQYALRFMAFITLLPIGIAGFFIYKFVVKKSEPLTIDKKGGNTLEQTPVEKNLTTNADKPPTHDDADFYLQATDEVETNSQKPTVWAKAMTLCEGDESKAKYKYITLRVIELTEEVTKNEANSEKQAKDS